MDVSLHYSRARLGRLAAMSLFMIGLLVWFALDGSVGRESGGLAGVIARTIGPVGMRVGAVVGAVVCVVLGLAYLRLLIASESLALGAGRDEVTVRSVFGTKVYPWREVDGLFIRSVSKGFREQRLVMVRGRGGRQAGVACNGLRETQDEVEAWMVAAERLRLAAIESR